MIYLKVNILAGIKYVGVVNNISPIGLKNNYYFLKKKFQSHGINLIHWDFL